LAAKTFQGVRYAVVVLWIAVFTFMAFVPLSGDEVFYAHAAQAFAEYLKGRITLADLQTTVVGFGWFTPGISLVLLPLYVLFHSPHLWLLRLYASALNLLLWRWTVREVHGAFGKIVALPLDIFPVLASSWLLFASTIWGDLPGGLVLTIVYARAYRIVARVGKYPSPSFKDVLVLELVILLTTYLRGSLLLPVLGIHLFLTLVWVISCPWAELLRRLGKLVAGLALFSALLAPWSLAASQLLGGLVVTTSTVPLSFGATFGDPSRLCFGACSSDNIWSSSVVFARDYARKSGLSELTVQRDMAEYALRDLTVKEYFKRVRKNFISFVAEPAAFSQRFVSLSKLGLGSTTLSIINNIISAETLVFYVPFFLALVIANVGFFPRATEAQIQILLLRLLTVSLFIQPFVHPSHSRYWVVFAPLMALSAGLLLSRRLERFPVDGEESPARIAFAPSTAVADRILLGLQIGYAVVVVMIFAIVSTV
jgi:hypothetical protein